MTTAVTNIFVVTVVTKVTMVSFVTKVSGVPIPTIVAVATMVASVYWLLWLREHANVYGFTHILYLSSYMFQFLICIALA